MAKKITKINVNQANLVHEKVSLSNINFKNP